MDDYSSLDAIDFDILAALQENARITNKELAARVGLSPSACLRRVQALEVCGAIMGAHTRVAPEAMGIGLQAMVSVRLAIHSREAFDAFRAHTDGIPEVIGVYSLSGADDFLLHVAVRDPSHLQEVTLGALAARSEVRHLETALIFEHSTSPGLPQLSRVSP